MNLIQVLGSDVVYSEGAVADLLTTLKQLSGCDTTIFLAGELRNGITFYSILFDTLFPYFHVLCCLTYCSQILHPISDAILEYFLEAAMKDFIVGRVDQSQWHPEYQSRRVALYVLVKKQPMNEPE